MMVEGEFYKSVTTKRNDSKELKSCMEQAVKQLLAIDTNINKPGMLLGKVQGGKTRAFIGMIALAFDNGYDMAVILTKGTKALAKQTHERLKGDFSDFVEDDKLQLFDILHIPENLPAWVLKQKLIMIVKKETNNLDRTVRALVKTYPDLSKRKVLIIDDEADYASIGFRANRQEGTIELRKIASQVDDLRGKVQKSSFMQVTATPYSLYLQPGEFEPTGDQETFIFKPVRPAFTVLLPTYSGHVGGDFYFKESKDESSVAYYVYEEIPDEELDILRREDGRSFKIEEALTHKKIRTLRRGLVSFIVGACIRRIQQRQSGQKEKKYSFVVHTEHSKAAHEWQREIVLKLKELLVYAANNNKALLEQLVGESYEDLAKSIGLSGQVPEYGLVLVEVRKALAEDYLMITKVNSEEEVEQLLDNKGQLKLTAPINVFIGGQILDRGVTIENLIGFYYGRRPGRFQQDTVLQHSRMYGNRPKEDLAVTRFYTALEIYRTMERINEFDTALREAFEREAQPGVVFICKDTANKIIPCSPNKILLSRITTIRPLKRMLPIGFQTESRTQMKASMDELDRIILRGLPSENSEQPFLMDTTLALQTIDLINATLSFEPDWEWDVEAFKASMEFLSKNTSKQTLRGKTWCLVRQDRKLSRLKQDGSFSDAPDTSSTELQLARNTAVDIPMLMLFRQNGEKAQGWRDSPFWWPVLVAPQRAATVVFASSLAENESMS